MSHKALIRCDFFRGSGAGHLRRCSVLADALRRLGLQVVFVLDANHEPLPFELSYPIEHVSEPFDEKKDGQYIINLADKLGATVVIGDSYRVSASWVSALQKAKLKVVFIDDLGIAGSADLRIDYSPMPKRLEGSAQSLMGPAFFLTESPHIAARDRSPERVILHAGGTGSFSAATKIYAIAAKVARTNGLSVTWLCPTETQKNWLQNSKLFDEGDFVLGWQQKRDLWVDYDIVVGPASTSLFEAILQDTLPVSFPISNTQTSDREPWLRLGHMLHVSSEEMDASSSLERLMQLAITEYRLLKSGLRSFAAPLDAGGTERVADAVCSILEGREVETGQTPTPSTGIRACDWSDAQAFLTARNAPHVRALSTDPDHIISWSEHLKWWLTNISERFVVEESGQAKAFFWHRAHSVMDRNYLIGGWFPSDDRPAFTTAIRLLDWQLDYCAEKYPNHLWIATINKENRAVLSLNRRYGFIDADMDSKAAAQVLFPGTTDQFTILQREA